MYQFFLIFFCVFLKGTNKKYEFFCDMSTSTKYEGSKSAGMKYVYEQNAIFRPLVAEKLRSNLRFKK